METEIKLLEMMARKGIRTIQELHETSGIARTLISQMLNGKKNVTITTIERLCETLDCDFHDLIVCKRK